MAEKVGTICFCKGEQGCDAIGLAKEVEHPTFKILSLEILQLWPEVPVVSTEIPPFIDIYKMFRWP